MAMRPDLKRPALAKQLGCTNAVLGKWLSGSSTAIDALLALEMRRVLGVSMRWLLTGEGEMAASANLSPDEQKMLNVWRLMDEDMQTFWLQQGKKLLAAQPPPKASAGWPYRPELTEARHKLRSESKPADKTAEKPQGTTTRAAR